MAYAQRAQRKNLTTKGIGRHSRLSASEHRTGRQPKEFVRRLRRLTQIKKNKEKKRRSFSHEGTKSTKKKKQEDLDTKNINDRC